MVGVCSLHTVVDDLTPQRRKPWGLEEEIMEALGGVSGHYALTGPHPLFCLMVFAVEQEPST